ncbi:MAG: chloride channel protein [Schaedlerella sp.]|nr:chloride channel protein [Schaedlerella sp.]
MKNYLKEHVKDRKNFVEKCIGRAYMLGHWLLLACIVGIVIGAIGGLFGRGITELTAFRKENTWMLYLLPLAGLVIIAIYKLDPYHTGTNLVLLGIQKGKYVPLRMASLIVVSTMLTHAFGGSAGREGAALQLGGSLGGTIGKYLKMDEYDRKVMIMCGMSAGFSALFGTPLTATVFSMEVISVGIMQYAAFVPCAIASIVAKEISLLVGGHAEHFVLPTGVAFDLKNVILTIILAVLCAAVSIVFCIVLHMTEYYMEKWFPNQWIRVVAGAVIIIVLAKVVGTEDYLGAGMDIVVRAIEGEVFVFAFLLKMIFTAITLGAGFKGGEIVPTLFVGATFGCLFGQITGLSPALSAACGMAALFSGVTNSPISTMFLCIELFGSEYLLFFLIAVSISYLESGYFGLYHSQKIMYSKTRLKFINTQTK